MKLKNIYPFPLSPYNLIIKNNSQGGPTVKKELYTQQTPVFVDKYSSTTSTEIIILLF